MKAVVSITIDEEFVVHDIKVIEGEKGLFIAMPSRKATDGEYRDIAHPIILPLVTRSRRSFSRNTRKLQQRKKLRYKKERGFYIPHFMERFMKCGIFFAKHSCDLPKLFHGILCLNLFYNHVFHYLSRFWIIVKYYVNVTKVK